MDADHSNSGSIEAICAWAALPSAAAAADRLRAGLAAAAATRNGRAAQAVCVLDATAPAAALGAVGFERRGAAEHCIWVLPAVAVADAATESSSAPAVIGALLDRIGPPMQQQRRAAFGGGGGGSQTQQTTTAGGTDDGATRVLRLRNRDILDDDAIVGRMLEMAAEHARALRKQARAARAEWIAVLRSAKQYDAAAVAEIDALLDELRAPFEQLMRDSSNTALAERVLARFAAVERRAALLMDLPVAEPPSHDDSVSDDAAADGSAWTDYHAQMAATAFAARYREYSRRRSWARRKQQQQQRRDEPSADSGRRATISDSGAYAGIGGRSTSPSRRRPSAAAARRRAATPEELAELFVETAAPAAAAVASPSATTTTPNSNTRSTARRVFDWVMQMEPEDNYEYRRLALGAAVIATLLVGSSIGLGVLPAFREGAGAFWAAISTAAGAHATGVAVDKAIPERVAQTASREARSLLSDIVGAHAAAAVADRPQLATAPFSSLAAVGADRLPSPTAIGGGGDALAIAAYPTSFDAAASSPPRVQAAAQDALAFLAGGSGAAVIAATDATAAKRASGLFAWISESLTNAAGVVVSPATDARKLEDPQLQLFFGVTDSDTGASMTSIVRAVAQSARQQARGDATAFGDPYALAARAMLSEPSFAALAASARADEALAPLIDSYLSSSSGITRGLMPLVNQHLADLSARLDALQVHSRDQLHRVLRVDDAATIERIIEARAADNDTAVRTLLRKQHGVEMGDLYHELHFGESIRVANFTAQSTERILREGQRSGPALDASDVGGTTRWALILSKMASASYWGSLTHVFVHWQQQAARGVGNAMRVAGERLERSADIWLHAQRAARREAGRLAQSNTDGDDTNTWWEHFRSLGWLGFGLESTGQTLVVGQRLLYHPLMTAWALGSVLRNADWSLSGLLGWAVRAFENTDPNAAWWWSQILNPLSRALTTVAVATTATTVAVAGVYFVFRWLRAPSSFVPDTVDRLTTMERLVQRGRNAAAVTWHVRFIGSIVLSVAAYGERTIASALSRGPLWAGAGVLTAAAVPLLIAATDPDKRVSLRESIERMVPESRAVLREVTRLRTLFIDRGARRRILAELDRESEAAADAAAATAVAGAGDDADDADADDGDSAKTAPPPASLRRRRRS